MIVFEVARLIGFVGMVPLSAVLASKAMDKVSLMMIFRFLMARKQRMLFLVVPMAVELLWLGYFCGASMVAFAALCGMDLVMAWVMAPREESKCKLQIVGEVRIVGQDEGADEEMHSAVAAAIDGDLAGSLSAADLEKVESKVQKELKKIVARQEGILANRANLALLSLHKDEELCSINNLQTCLRSAFDAHKRTLARLVDQHTDSLREAISKCKERQSLEEPVQCPVCLRDNVAENLLILRPCNHCLCGVCASKVLFGASQRHTGAQCPCCRAHISGDVIHPDKPINSVGELQAYIKQKGLQTIKKPVLR